MEYDNNITDLDDTMSHRTVSLYITLAMLTIFSFCGVVGNALVLYVYVRKHDRLTSTFFIIVLAAIDIVTCFIIIPWTIYLEYIDFHINSDLCCKLYQFMVSSNIPFSAFIMVAIAVDRYFCICHPFLQAMTMTRAQITSAVMGLYAAGLGSLVACMFGVYQLVQALPQDFQYNETVTEMPEYMNNMSELSMYYNYYDQGIGPLKVSFIGYCTKTNLIFSDEFIDNYRSFHAAQYLISLVCIIILYALIYHKVHSRRLRRLQQTTSLSLPLVPRNTTMYTQDTEITHNGDNHNDSPSPNRSAKASDEKEEDIDNASTRACSSSSSHKSQIDECAKADSKENGEEREQLSKQNSTASTSPSRDAAKVCKLNSGSIRAAKGGDNTCEIGHNRSNKHRNSRKDRMRSANIKTAIMLSVVTIVFVVTYAPAFIMSCFPYLHGKLGATAKLLHYFYFANNVANPIIYSFMNQNFRADLKQIFTGRNRY